MSATPTVPASPRASRLFQTLASPALGRAGGLLPLVALFRFLRRAVRAFLPPGVGVSRRLQSGSAGGVCCVRWPECRCPNSPGRMSRRPRRPRPAPQNAKRPGADRRRLISRSSRKDAFRPLNLSFADLVRRRTCVRFGFRTLPTRIVTLSRRSPRRRFHLNHPVYGHPSRTGTGRGRIRSSPACPGPR